MTNTISKDQAVALAREAGIVPHPGNSGMNLSCSDETIQALTQAAYKLGRNAGLEEAKQVCNTVAAEWATFHQVAPSAAYNCATAIEYLEDNTP